MRGQLRRLLELADRPIVVLQLLPFEVGAYPGTMLGPFDILWFERLADPGVVYVESDSDPYPDREGDLQRYTAAFTPAEHGVVCPPNQRPLCVNPRGPGIARKDGAGDGRQRACSRYWRTATYSRPMALA